MIRFNTASIVVSVCIGLSLCSLQIFAQTLVPFSSEGLYGLKQLNGKVIVPPKYHAAWKSSEGLSRVMKYVSFNDNVAELYGFVDINGREIIPLKYDFACDFHEGFAVVGSYEGTKNFVKFPNGVFMDNRMIVSYIDTHGNVCKFDPEPNYAEDLKNGKAIIAWKDHFITPYHPCNTVWTKQEISIKQLFLALNQKVIVRQDSVTSSFEKEPTFHGTLLNINNFSIEDGKILYHTLNNKHILDIVNENPNISGKISYNIPDSLLKPIVRHGLYGFEYQGKLVIPCKYTYYYPMSHGRIPVLYGNMWRLIDKSGNQIDGSRLYEKMKPFINGTSVVGRGDKAEGCINENGDEIVKPKDNTRIYQQLDNIVVYRCGKHYGAVDTRGKQIIPLVYQYISGEKYNRFCVTDTLGRKGLVDKRNNTVIPFKYKEIEDLGDFAIVRDAQNDHYGVIDISGKTLIPFNFGGIDYFHHNMFLYKKKSNDKLYGVICNDGKELLSQLYDEVVEYKGRYSKKHIGSYRKECKDDDSFDYAVLRRSLPAGSYRYTVINHLGSIIINEANKVIEGGGDLCLYQLNGRTAVVDITGKEILSSDKDSMIVHFNRVHIIDGKKHTIYNEVGKKICKLQYDEYSFWYYYKPFAVRQGNLWGMADENGQLIIPLISEEKPSIISDKIIVKANGVDIKFDINGNRISK